MAKKGYLFEKVTLPGVYQFRKNEPTNMIYRIDFNPQKKENRESYLQMFKDYGWEYIQNLNEFSYFCKLDNGTEDEIFNDNESRIAMLERISTRKMMPILAIFLCLIILQGMHIFMGGNYTDSVLIVFYLVWIVVFYIYIALITRCTVGFNKLRKKYAIK